MVFKEPRLCKPKRRPSRAFTAAVLLASIPTCSASFAQTTAAIAPKVSGRQGADAERAYLDGAKSLRNQAYAKAEEHFARAVTLDPLRAEYVEALALAQEHRITELLQRAASVRSSDAARADALLAEARTIDPQNPRLIQRDADTPAAAALLPTVRTQLASAITLAPSTARHSFHQRSDTRSLAQAVAQAYGLSLVADPELAPKQMRLDLDDVDYATAARVLQMMSTTLFIPLDEKTFLLAGDTATNRTRLERMVEETFNLPGYTTEQINEIANVARTVFDVRQVSVRPTGSDIVLRAPEDTITAIDAIFRDLVDSEPEVLVELKLYAVDKSNIRNLGIVLPQQFSAYSVASETQTILSQNSALIQQLIASGVLPATATPQQIALYLLFVAGLGNSTLIRNSFLIFGGGLSLGAVSAGNTPTLNLALTQSEARTLDDLQLRVTDRQTATFRIGTRYPIQTSVFSTGGTSTAGGALAGIQVNGVPLSRLLSSVTGGGIGTTGQVLPQFQYEDLGLTVKAIPHIQRSGEVLMHVEFKLDALAGSSLNGIPVLASRQFSSDLAMQNGETTMMVSFLSRSESSAVSGVPGLSEIPGFQSTTNQDKNVNSSELVLLLTPHVVRRGHSAATGPYTPLINRPSND